MTSKKDLICIDVGDIFKQYFNHETYISSMEHLEISLSLIKDINHAFQTQGFLLMKNPGVKNIPLVKKMTKEFFHQSEHDKNKVAYRAPVPRGYTGNGKENFACLVGEKKPNDLVEKFRVGPMLKQVEEYIKNGYFNQSDKDAQMMYYPNKWPSHPSEFSTVIQEYYHQMEIMSLCLLHLFEKCLNLPKGYFDSKMDKHTSILSMNSYPIIDTNKRIQKGQLRLARHTDVDLFTIVLGLEDSFGGLQLQTPCTSVQQDGICLLPQDENAENTNWTSIPMNLIESDTFVINIGDGFMYWTHGYWTSTPHRVIIPDDEKQKQKARYSIAYFVGSNFDAKLESLPTASIHSNSKNYPPLTYAEWRRKRIQKAIGQLKLKQKNNKNNEK